MRLAPALFATLLLAAHFFRWGSILGILACLTVPLLALLVQRPWSMRALQGLLALGCATWLGTALSIGRERAAMGEPWLRMALILGAVAAFTAWSAWLLQGTEILRPKRT